MGYVGCVTAACLMRDGHDVHMELPINVAQAALGASLEVPTLDGEIEALEIPAGTQTGKTFRVRNHGVEDGKGNRGDLLVVVSVTVPEKLTNEGEELLKQFRKQNPNDNPRSHLGV